LLKYIIFNNRSILLRGQIHLRCKPNSKKIVYFTICLGGGNGNKYNNSEDTNRYFSRVITIVRPCAIWFTTDLLKGECGGKISSKWF
jgi:hypothetical protein